MAADWIHTSAPQQLIFGHGVSDRLRPVLKEAGVRRALVLCGPGRAASPQIETIVSGLSRFHVATCTAAEAQTPTTSVQAAMQAVAVDDIDVIVSVGGGSTIDLGKAVVFFTEQQAGTPGTYFADRPAIAHIAVPTTFAGAEASAEFAMTDAASGQKSTSGLATTMPRVVVHDPALMADLPADLTASTAVGALTRVIEGLVSGFATPESVAVGHAGVARLYGALAAAIAPSSDDDARLRLLEGVALAGRASHATPRGIASVIATLAGGRSGVHHGSAMAALLVPTLRYLELGADAAMGQIAATIGVDSLADALASLLVEVDLTAGLESLGVSEDDADAIARMSQADPAIQRAPRPTGEGDVRALIEEAWQ